MKISVRMIFISNVRLRITKTLMPYSLMCTMTIEIYGIWTDTSAMIMSLLVSKIYFIYCSEFIKSIKIIGIQKIRSHLFQCHTNQVYFQ